MRVEFNPLFDMILKEAKQDGCIWIPYEVTEEENRQKKVKKGEDEETKTNVTPNTQTAMS